MSTTTSIPDSTRVALLKKLDTHHGPAASESSSSQTDGTDGAGQQDESESELVLRLILDSKKCTNESEVEAAVEEYVQGKPLAYITGLHTFGPLAIVIRPPVYIPRVETEQWVLLLAQKLLSSIPAEQNLRIMDVCSGSGCIPLLLAQQGEGRIQTVGLEVDDRALSVARENAKLNHIDHLSTFEKFDLFQDDIEELQKRLGTFDMVISNPPYVSSEDMSKLGGKWWEGNFALQGKLKNDGDNDKDDGLSFYRRIREIYPAFLSTNRTNAIPKCALEVGATQSAPVQDMYRDDGRLEVYKETKRRRDVNTPKLEKGNMEGTERSLWVYDS